MGKRLVMLVCFGLALTQGPGLARAEVWHAPPYLDWFVGKFHRLLSHLKLSPEQRRAVAVAKKPLADAVKASVLVERARIKRLRALFAQPEITEEDYRKLIAERVLHIGKSDALLRAEGLRLIIALHKILRPEQRHLLTDEWAQRAERRFFQAERPVN